MDNSRKAGLMVLLAVVLDGCAPQMRDDPPQFMLVARERLRPGTDEAYDKNELQLANLCATLACPHPYLALATTAGPKEIWWLNAFASREEQDGLDAAYAKNKDLMAAMRPLGKRKEDFRESFTSTVTEYRADLSRGSGLPLAGARFLVVKIAQGGHAAAGAVFQVADGTQFVLATASRGAAAKEIADHMGPGALILAVQPQWSFPAQGWIDADPEFWHSNPEARRRGFPRR